MVLCFREELCSFQREIEVLSEQYSQKCLENAHLAQALEAERQALRQCQRENQELNAHNQVRTHTRTRSCTAARQMFLQDSACSSTPCPDSLLKLLFDCVVLQELNNRLAAEITKMRSMTSEDGAGDSGTTIQGKELYELEVRGAAAATAALEVLLRIPFQWTLNVFWQQCLSEKACGNIPSPEDHSLVMSQRELIPPPD